MMARGVEDPEFEAGAEHARLGPEGAREEDEIGGTD